MAALSSLHARKTELQRREISSIAFELFLARGFDEVTFDDIAAAAKISRRTLFRYFETKEDLLVSQLEAFGRVLADAVMLRPSAEDPLTALRNGLRAAATTLESEPASLRKLLRFIAKSGKLRSRMNDKHEKWRSALSVELAKRLSGRRKRETAEAIAASGVALLDVALKRWIASDRRSLATVLEEAFRDLLGAR
jgi:AcrR family transcriptional regulator